MPKPATTDLLYPLLKLGFTCTELSAFSERLLDWFTTLDRIPLSGERALWIQERHALRCLTCRGGTPIVPFLNGNPPCICWDAFSTGSIRTGSIDKAHCRGCLGSKSAVILALPILAEEGTQGVISLGLHEPLFRNDADINSLFSELIPVLGTVITAVRQREQMLTDVMRYRTLLDTISDAMIHIDSDGTILSINAAAVRMFGYEPDELIDRPVTLLMADPYRSCHNDFLRNYLSTGVRHVIGSSRELNGAQRKDGTVFPVELRVAEIHIHGKPAFLALIQDLTERKEVERQLREARDQAIASNRIKSEFLANMSHEIRTPMTGVIGMTEILLDSGLTETQSDYARIIQQSAASLLTILNDILDFSKIEAGKLHIDRVRFNLMTVLEDVVDLFSEMARTRRIEIGLLMDSHITLGVGSTFWFSIPLQKRPDAFGWEADTQEEENIAQSTRCLIVDANATSRKILDHYLTNWNIPHQAASDPTSALDMLRDAALAGTPFNLVLLDLAMPQTDGLMLAERIQRNDRFGRPKMILLSSLGGHVDPHALRDAGLDGFLTKPVRQSKLFDTMMTVLRGKGQKVSTCLDSYLLRKSPIPPQPLKSEGSERYRVLLVEDNPVNQKTAYILLKKLGYDVDLAENGRQAIAKVMENLYDIVFMDVQMPEMDGLEAVRRIRHLEGDICHTPIVAMTAHAMAGDREKCIEAGMDDYLSKPIDREALAAVLQKWLYTKKPIEQPPPL